MELIAGLAALGALLIIILIPVLILYVLNAIGLMKLSRANGVEPDWLSFIPLAQYYNIGGILEGEDVFGQNIQNLKMVLPITVVALSVLGSIDVLSSITATLLSVVSFSSTYYIFKKYKPEEATKMILISIFTCGIGASIYMFLLGNEVEKSNS